MRVLKQGLGEGWSTEHTMDELSNYLKGPGYNKRRLEVIARTNATSAFNQGRLETFRQAGDFVKFVQFLAILDRRTTDICESRNGRLLRLDSPELAANTPPLHFQCRSVFSPVTAYDLKEMEKPGWKDAEGRTLEQLQDWSKVDAPAKGFGGNSGAGKPPAQTGRTGGGKKPPEPPKTSQLPAGDGGGEKPGKEQKPQQEGAGKKEATVRPPKMEREPTPPVSEKSGKGEPLPKTEGTGGSKPPEPPLGGAGGGGPMGPESPWKKIPDWFYDKKFISQDEVDLDDNLRVYEGIQKFFNKPIAPRAVNEFLFGDGINGIVIKSIESEPSGSADRWMLNATIELPNGGEAEIKRSLFFNDKSKIYFDLMKSKKSIDEFPQGFAQEYFKRAIPALRELEIKTIETMAYSNATANYSGAYVWCRYGYTNKNIKQILKKYINYLEDYHGIYLDVKRQDAIMKIDRMWKLADDEINGKKIAREMLLGKRTNCEWNGIIPDINDDSSDEIIELRNYLIKRQ